MGARSTLVIGAGLAVLLGTLVVSTRPGNRDLEGNWTNETLTPLERLGDQAATMTDDEAAALERKPPTRAELFRDANPPVIRINGKARTSIINDPKNGRVPPRTEAGQQRLAEITAARRRFGEFDHPELRTIGERCLASFGSNAGPPMLPNYAYNNNYTIVQTPDHVMILSEMNHDARIIRIGANTHPPPRVRPWFGDSIGRWQRNTLVIETTNIHPVQAGQITHFWPYAAASARLKVMEWLTRTGPDEIHYRFTIEDPDTYTAPFSGELPFRRLDEPLYEYACHEGNYSLSNMLSVARATER